MLSENQMSKQVPVVELTTAPRRDDADLGIETTADALDNPASGRDRVGQVLEARYSLVRKVDEGGMGVVYEGRHLKLDRRVAVKVMDARGRSPRAESNVFIAKPSRLLAFTARTS